MDELNPDSSVIGEAGASFIDHQLFSPNENEKTLIKLLQGLVRSIKWRPEEVSQLFNDLLQRFELVNSNDRSHLLTWLLQMLHCIQVNYITPSWRSRTGRSLLELVRDTAVTNEELKACTGVVENFMKWSDGLQQFLEMKHQSKLSDMTIISNYMSNVGLLQKYKSQIYGLSGTLGQQAEIETMRKIYEGINTCQIPSFKRRKLFEAQGVIMKDEKIWIEKICEVVAEQIKPTQYRSSRAVLVICETIKLAKTLHQGFGDKIPNKNLYINNNMDNKAIFDKKLGAEDVIIATNLAGRGTDLKISDSIKEAGGLFVVQTFLPKNARVEAQAFGRAGRQGAPGSAQLIACSTHMPENLQLLILIQNLKSFLGNIGDISATFLEMFLMELRQYQGSNTRKESLEMSLLLSHILAEKSSSDMSVAKEIRDSSVAEQLSNYVECYLPKIKKKEELFNQYLDTLNLLYKSNNNKPAESDVTALNEFWGMWLLTKFSEDGSAVGLKTNLSADLSAALQKLRQRESPSSNIHYYTAKGSELEKMGRLSESIDMYTKVIKQDPCWAAVAFYNRASASLLQKNRNQDQACLRQALEDFQKALLSVKLYCDQLDVTYHYAGEKNTESARELNNRFDKQKEAKRAVLVSLMSNISEAIAAVNMAREAGRCVQVEGNPVYLLASLEYIMTLAIISILSKRVQSTDPLNRYQLINQPSFDTFLELRSFEIMGLTQIYVLEIVSSGGIFSKLSSLFGFK
ncbi:hypothetical protein CCH79_00019267 [Gambusia affinis]|uniref:Uncharacterized protein n=1 Tax=Gambusia affinis TaxID=33528 RepID=A0A315VJ35_GAMAF|nr:hypothetical protein CCH79_00019267 [Gambusia affinis]